jgi:hypothetical protein
MRFARAKSGECAYPEFSRYGSETGGSERQDITQGDLSAVLFVGRIALAKKDQVTLLASRPDLSIRKD